MLTVGLNLIPPELKAADLQNNVSLPLLFLLCYVGRVAIVSSELNKSLLLSSSRIKAIILFHGIRVESPVEFQFVGHRPGQPINIGKERGIGDVHIVERTKGIGS